MPDYHDRRYEKLWHAFSETGVVVANHLTLKNSLWDVFRRDPSPQKGIFTALPGFAIAETLMGYILTGVLERHPKLRVVFVEPGLFWLPGFIRFLDSRMHQHYEFPGVKLLPSEYFRRQMAATFVHEPEAIAARHELGVENVLMVLEISSIIAMIVYLLIGWLLERIVYLVFYRPARTCGGRYRNQYQ